MYVELHLSAPGSRTLCAFQSDREQIEIRGSLILPLLGAIAWINVLYESMSDADAHAYKRIIAERLTLVPMPHSVWIISKGFAHPSSTSGICVKPLVQQSQDKGDFIWRNKQIHFNNINKILYNFQNVVKLFFYFLVFHSVKCKEKKTDAYS